MNTSDAAGLEFRIRDCALIALATGRRAQSLREVVSMLPDMSNDCIYYHFWGDKLRPRFDNPEFHNDFSMWAAKSLHDKVLAEKLGVIDPTEYSTEELKTEVIEVIEEYMDNFDHPHYSRRDEQFEFIRAQIVVFDSNKTVDQPAGLSRILPTLSLGSIFFHFIDARRRNENSVDDFSNWLTRLDSGHTDLIEKIAGIDPHFLSLNQIRDQLVEIFHSFFAKETA